MDDREDQNLKLELDEIMKRVDAIMEKVAGLYPDSAESAGQKED